MRLDRTEVTESPVGRILIRLAFPMVGGLLATMLFGLVDTFFIARLGPLPLAAMGFTFPVIFMVTGTAMGMGIGMTSVVARAVGEGDQHQVAELTTGGLLLAFIVVALFVLAGLGLHDRLFRLLGAGPDLVPLIGQYMKTWFMGVMFLVIMMVGSSAIRATGDSFSPSMIMIIAGVLNAMLDPLLIFGLGPFPRMELRGAALATIISYLITFVAAFHILVRREKMISFKRLVWARLWDTWRRMMYVGFPAVATNLMVPLAVGIVTRLLAGYGASVVAAYGVASRIESLAMVVHFALSSVMAAFAGQNIGAGRVDRVRAGLRFALQYCLLLGAGLWLVLAVGAKTIAGWFTDDPGIVTSLLPYLWLVPLSYGPLGYMLATASSFNAANKPRYSVFLFVTRFFGLMVPLALIGSLVAGVPGIYVGLFTANVLSGALAFGLQRRVYGKPIH